MESLKTETAGRVAAAPTVLESADLRLPPRVLGRVGDPRRGATLICIGGLHGNEPAGVIALRRVIDRLEAEQSPLGGCLVALAGNRKALARRCRFIDRDLNRIWRRSELSRVREAGASEVAEDEELLDLDTQIRAALAEARGRTYVLDIHTTSGPGPAFVIYEDTLPNREFAMAYPVTLVLGIEEELGGTLSTYIAGQGVTTVGFEAGQHDESEAADRAEGAIWIALEEAGITETARPEVAAARNRFESERRDVPHVVEVRYRHPIRADDGFRMRPGYVSFQTVEAGELLASDVRGAINAPQSGRILMPLYQEQGEDGFFVVRPIQEAWLGLSSAVRRIRLERIAHWLPGVRRDPSEAGAFEVDTKVARWFTQEFFHLLGFRRVAQDDRFLRMRRRRFDD